MPRHTHSDNTYNPKWQVQREYFSRIRRRSNEFQLLRPTTEYKDEEGMIGVENELGDMNVGSEKITTAITTNL